MDPELVDHTPEECERTRRLALKHRAGWRDSVAYCVHYVPPPHAVTAEELEGWHGLDD